MALGPKDLLLQVDSRKLAPRYTDHIINPSVVHLKLPLALKVHPTFHVSLLKPVVESPLVFGPEAKQEKLLLKLQFLNQLIK